jgi:hypothetical protein
MPASGAALKGRALAALSSVRGRYGKNAEWMEKVSGEQYRQ